ncbi:putative protein of unknown function (Doubtful CDS) [Bradyrhizobium sp. ORS 285]|nr:putative protein of unknown function (Doubtful CDS) [Bradyrhizobium sp. ORS 285]
MHSPVQKDLLSHAGHPEEMRRGNVMDVRTTIVKISHGHTIRGVPQLNGEGMHNACFYLRETVGADATRTDCHTRREAAQRAGRSRSPSRRTSCPTRVPQELRVGLAAKQVEDVIVARSSRRSTCPPPPATVSPAASCPAITASAATGCSSPRS